MSRRKRHDDPRYHKPRGYYRPSHIDPDELSRIQPRVPGMDVVILTSIIAAWILVAIFLVREFKKPISESPFMQTMNHMKNKPLSKSGIPSWKGTNKPQDSTTHFEEKLMGETSHEDSIEREPKNENTLENSNNSMPLPGNINMAPPPPPTLDQPLSQKLKQVGFPSLLEGKSNTQNIPAAPGKEITETDLHQNKDNLSPVEESKQLEEIP